MDDRYFSVMDSTDINGVTIKLAYWDDQQGRYSEFLNDYINENDRFLLIPLRTTSRDQLHMFPITYKGVQELIYEDGEEVEKTEKICAYCQEPIDHKTDFISFSRVHRFIFHKNCFEETVEILQKSIAEFSDEFMSRNI